MRGDEVTDRWGCARRRGAWATCIGLWLVACGGDDSITVLDASTGCPELRDPLAMPGDPIGGDDFGSVAQPFFDAYCTRCHSIANTTLNDRSGAPAGYDWDVEDAVRRHLPAIRHAVGVSNYMPIGMPQPTCDERARLVRWIDAAAP